MILGGPRRPNPTIQVPQLTVVEDPAAEICSPSSNRFLANKALTLEALTALLPASNPDPEFLGPDSPVDAYSCDYFRMYEFKVRRCTRGRSHDWTECPYAHPGEKARRRDPRKYHYSGTACADFRKGGCRMGDSCEFAHGVFECWLHPSRYRTQPCKDGANCRRRVCFFAHSPDQLRVLPDPTIEAFDGYPFPLVSLSPAKSTSPPVSPRAESSSPPMSPMTQSLSRSTGPTSFSEVVASLRNFQLNKVRSLPSSWNPQGWYPPPGSTIRPGFRSLPATPTSVYAEIWSKGGEEDPSMERVESGRELRAKMLEKLRKENSLDSVDRGGGGANGEPANLNWVSDPRK